MSVAADFTEWFDGSKPVDAQGLPLFHGTDACVRLSFGPTEAPPPARSHNLPRASIDARFLRSAADRPISLRDDRVLPFRSSNRGARIARRRHHRL